MQIYLTKDFLKKTWQTHFFLSVTWHLNQVSVLVSWSKNDFFENHQFWSLFKTETGKRRKIDFLEKHFQKQKNTYIYFFSGENVRIGEVYMHFILSMWCSLTLQKGSLLALLQIIFFGLDFHSLKKLSTKTGNFHRFLTYQEFF